MLPATVNPAHHAPRLATSYPTHPTQVEWCVSNIADHGGLYSYRICQDDSIVAKVIIRVVWCGVVWCGA